MRTALDDVPRYPRSRLRQAAVERSSSVYVATFTVPEVTPTEIVEYFGEQLMIAGWDASMPPTRLGEAVRARWQQANRELLVSSAPAPTVEGSDAADRDATAQYSLTLTIDTERAGPRPPNQSS